MGAQRNAAARGGGCAGAGRARQKGGGVLRRGGRGWAFAGTTGNGCYAGRHGGRFRRGKPGRSFRAAGRQRGAGGAWPRGAHKGRVSGATARCGHVAGRRGAGGIRRLSGADAGKARPGAAVYGGRAGYSRGAAGLLPGRGGWRRGTGKKRSELRGLCRVTGHRWEGGSGAGEKARFRHIRKRFSRGAGFVDSELICLQKLVALVGLLFRRPGVMNVSRRAGRAKSPAGKRNATQRKEHTP